VQYSAHSLCRAAPFG